MRVSYIGKTPAFQAGKVGSIPTTRSIKDFEKNLDKVWKKVYNNKRSEKHVDKTLRKVYNEWVTDLRF